MRNKPYGPGAAIKNFHEPLVQPSKKYNAPKDWAGFEPSLADKLKRRIEQQKTLCRARPMSGHAVKGYGIKALKRELREALANEVSHA